MDYKLEMKENEPQFDYRKDNEWITQYHAFSFDKGGINAPLPQSDEIVLFSVENPPEESDFHEEDSYLMQETLDIRNMQDEYWYFPTLTKKFVLPPEQYAEYLTLSNTLKLSITELLINTHPKDNQQKTE